MSELAEIITGEFEEAVEVKNPKSLQRGIYLLLNSTVRREEHEKEHDGLKSAMQTMGKNVELLALEMREGFKRMDERFESMEKRMELRAEATDKRFESMDSRFETMERSITRVTTILSIGILLITALIAIFKFI